MNKEISNPVAIACFVGLTVVSAWSSYRFTRELNKLQTDVSKHVEDCMAESEQMMQNLGK